MASHKITICMGSSCYARENKENLIEIQKFIKQHKLDVIVEGTLCTNRCAEGPNICIDGKWFNYVTPNVLNDILKHHFGV